MICIHIGDFHKTDIESDKLKKKKTMTEFCNQTLIFQPYYIYKNNNRIILFLYIYVCGYKDGSKNSPSSYRNKHCQVCFTIPENILCFFSISVNPLSKYIMHLKESDLLLLRILHISSICHLNWSCSWHLTCLWSSLTSHIISSNKYWRY